MIPVKHHGQDAPIEAAMRADAMLEVGDPDGYAIWKRVVKVTEGWGGKGLSAGSTVQ